jgi:hypothetical protein
MVAVELIVGWDGQLGTDSVGGAVYHVACELMVQALLHAMLAGGTTSADEAAQQAQRAQQAQQLLNEPDGAATKWMLAGDGMGPLRAVNELSGGVKQRMVNSLMQAAVRSVAAGAAPMGGGSRLTGVAPMGGSAPAGAAAAEPLFPLELVVALLQRCLAKATRQFTSVFGKDTSTWQWGAIHPCVFRHSMSEALTGPPIQPPQQRGEEEAVVVESRSVQSRLDVPKFPLGGDANTVAQAGTRANYDKFGFQAVGTMVSMREVLDLSDWDNCRMVLPVGQSGICGSRHYQDQVELWRRGELHPMLWSRPQVDKHTESVLVLTPRA